MKLENLIQTIKIDDSLSLIVYAVFGVFLAAFLIHNMSLFNPIIEKVKGKYRDIFTISLSLSLYLGIFFGMSALFENMYKTNQKQNVKDYIAAIEDRKVKEIKFSSHKKGGPVFVEIALDEQVVNQIKISNAANISFTVAWDDAVNFINSQADENNQYPTVVVNKKHE